MTKLFVKICGITRAQDADLAAGLGASALGFVFWPGSPRYISPEAARDIVRAQPRGVMNVGVFVDEPVEQVARVIDMVGLDAAQLHGRESAEYCRQLLVRLKPDTTTTTPATDVVSGFSRTVIKAIGLQDSDPVALDAFDPDVVILLDAFDPDRHGGTGRTANWDSARQIAASRRSILAGGLNSGNIGRAVASVRPYGVDVSSGVESAPGVKDADRLKSFFEALHD